MSQKNIINIRIGGVPYTIKTDEPAVNVERAAADVDRRIAAHQRDAEWLSTEKALALTSIELADRYLRLKDEVDNVNARYRETSKQLFYLQKETDELKQQLFELKQGGKSEPLGDEPENKDGGENGYGYGGEVSSFV
jgi:cell division protein ZapA (FtsZ GTPase activity inhibitor)